MTLAGVVDTGLRYLDAVYYVYLLLLFVFILLSWVRLPYNVWFDRFRQFLDDTVGVYLRLFRRALPMLRVGMLDLTPIAAIFALSIVWRLIRVGIEQLT